MAYACATWKRAVDAHLMKLHRLQNRVLSVTRYIDKCIQVRELHVASKSPYVHYYVAELCRTKAEVIAISLNPNVRIGDFRRGKGSQV
jgi:hypothetical protein